jgi:hypothetical protein
MQPNLTGKTNLYGMDHNNRGPRFDGGKLRRA